MKHSSARLIAAGLFIATVVFATIAIASAAEARVRVSRDPDQDGLTTRREQRIGTDPFKPDTDGDGLLDGTEVRKTKTSPLSADTDTDTLDDGAEVELGTDPRDPHSVLPPRARRRVGLKQSGAFAHRWAIAHR